MRITAVSGVTIAYLVFMLGAMFYIFAFTTLGSGEPENKAGYYGVEVEPLVADSIYIVKPIVPKPHYQADYSSILVDGLKQISKDHRITNIVPVTREVQTGSVTSSLIVFVVPK